MLEKVAVLGAGHVGFAIAQDLHNSGVDVVAIDESLKRINTISQTGIISRRCDVTNFEELEENIADCKLVVGALPGSLGFQTIENAIKLGKNVVDISFCPEDYMKLDNLAKEKNVTVITDMGVAPGLCNVLLGYHDKTMDVDSYKCIVGGLPFKREWPLEYQATWSPIDVLEEYTRPARYVENSKIMVRPAMSDPQLVHFNQVGTLEEWNSDGLRSLIQTMPHVPNMIEKTLRYPGTIEYLRVLKELGFFSENPVEIDGRKIKPIDVTAKLLFPKWKMQEGDREFTVMRVTISGIENGKNKTYVYNLFDEYDTANNITSMARTTGYTCTGAVLLVMSGMFRQKGVCPPEFIGRDLDSYKFLLDHLYQRGVQFIKEETV